MKPFKTFVEGAVWCLLLATVILSAALLSFTPRGVPACPTCPVTPPYCPQKENACCCKEVDKCKCPKFGVDYPLNKRKGTGSTGSIDIDIDINKDIDIDINKGKHKNVKD